MLDHVRRILWVSVICGCVAALYSGIFNGAFGFGFLIGAGNGAALSTLELFSIRGWAAGLLRRLPFIAYLLLRVALYVAVIAAVQAIVFASFANLRAVGFTSADYLFTALMCLFGNVLMGIDDLLGQGVLLAFVAGRYHRPQREQRALLFIDMRNSTTAAERLGEERFLDLLNAFFADISPAITDCGGTIYKYVGDEIIATWPLRDGQTPAHCVRACFLAVERLEAKAESYERLFGSKIAFRAALHGGALVVGELGYRKREIALIGDAVKTPRRASWRPVAKPARRCSLRAAFSSGWRTCRLAFPPARWSPSRSGASRRRSRSQRSKGRRPEAQICASRCVAPERSALPGDSSMLSCFTTPSSTSAE